MKAREVINQALKHSRYRVDKTAPAENEFSQHRLRLELHHLVAEVIADKGSCFVVQVGANDGITNDPLFPMVQRWPLKGLVIEPLPEVFASLKEAYAPFDEIKPLNLAVHPSESSVVLYSLDPAKAEKLNRTPTGIASLSRDHLLKWKKKIPGVESMIIESKVPASHLMEILDKESVTHIDLLQIDVEGFDYEIIKMLDFTKLAPTIIRYEHSHLSEEDARACLNHLIQNGYQIYGEQNDMIARRNS